MNQTKGNIMLGHGSGGKMMHDLIENVFIKKFNNNILTDQTDSAILNSDLDNIAFTTDSFVIDPVVFPGGNIGKLAVCGTVNDLAVSGAIPAYLSVSFIIEEGFPVEELEKIAESLAAEAQKAGVSVVTGDTKIVNKGKCDKLFINTSGIGFIRKENISIGKGSKVAPGDFIIINGTIGDHGMAVLNARESFNFTIHIESDCASLNHLIKKVTDKHEVKFMRDPTRGGVAAVLNELALKTGFGIEIEEDALPIKKGVKAMCELLGFDPLHIANEGKVIMVVPESDVQSVLEILKNDTLGMESSAIGRIVTEHQGRVVLRNQTGGSRIIDTLSGDQLPRIC